MSKRRVGYLLGAFAAFAAAGCSLFSDETSPAGDGALGSVSIAVQNVPSDIRCIQINAAGSRVQSQMFNVTPGAPSQLVMPGISPGSTTFSGASYPLVCGAVVPGSVPTWVADAVTANIAAGTQTNVTLVMRPAGSVGIGVDFQGGADGGVPLGVWDSTNWDLAVWQ